MIDDPDCRTVRMPAYDIADFRWGRFGQMKDSSMAASDEGNNDAPGASRGEAGETGAGETGAGETGAGETQGKAVKKALAGDRSIDIDRWDGFSRADAARLAADPAPPEGAQKPKAGLAGDGGLVEGES